MQDLSTVGHYYLFVFVVLAFIMNIWKVEFQAHRKLLLRMNWDADIDHPNGD